MTKLLMSILKALLLLVVLAAIGFGGLLLAQYRGWPNWVALLAIAAALFIFVLVFFLRRYFLRRRERAFVKRVVAQDLSVSAESAQRKPQRLLDLEERWSAAIATLRAAPRQHNRDPLYARPWFMMLGDTGSGKTAALTSSRLPSILTDADPAVRTGATRNCDWWFFADAVMLDTAGRYAVPRDKEDQLEWEDFLTLLAKYRRKEPLNGLIVTLPADRLLAGDEDALSEYGRVLRRRIDQLMRVLGTRFPVYLLLTKMDLVFGMSALSQLLPAGARGQVVGLLNESTNRRPADFLTDAIHQVTQRLKEARLRLSYGAAGNAGRAMLFPDEFERLGPAIAAFVTGAFHETPYLETPLLRGIFISSARQSGPLKTGVLGGLASTRETSWGSENTSQGLFLPDIFTTILPQDRQSFRRIREYLKWRSTTAGLALGAWYLLLITVVGLASLSYITERDAMTPARQAFPSKPQLGVDRAADLVTLGTLRDNILTMEQGLQGRLPPALAFFSQGDTAVTALKQRYVEWFRTYVLQPMERAMGERLAVLQYTNQSSSIEPFLEYLVWRVATVKNRNSKNQAQDDGLADPLESIALSFGRREPYVIALFPDLYRTFVNWETNQAVLESELKQSQTMALQLIQRESTNLHWLTDWADSKPGLSAVTLGNFWPGMGTPDPSLIVAAAFTRAGKDEIERFLTRLALVIPSSDALAPRTAAFWSWYAAQFYSRWGSFASQFDTGRNLLLTRLDWMNAGATMPTMENPYFHLINRMNDEFTAIASLAAPAPIAQFSKAFYEMSRVYQGKTKAATWKQKVIGRVAEVDSDLAQRTDVSAIAAKDLADYLTALGTLLPATTSTDAAFRLIAESYSQAPNPKTSGAVDLATAAAHRLRQSLGKGNADQGSLQALIDGPLDFLVAMLLSESACGFNEVWQTDVVAPAFNLPQGELWQQLFDKQGLVPKFLGGPAKPFLRQTPRGWTADTWMGIKFPLQDPFLSFLNQGSINRPPLQPSYTVTVSAQPTNINKTAKSIPRQTQLALTCKGEQQVLDNFNFPSSRNFTWEPETCGEVDLKIVMPEVTLTKTWPGPEGFLAFLRTFERGSAQFRPTDFPTERDILEGLAVEQIQVKYIIKNAGAIKGIVQYPPLLVPEQAATCLAVFQQR
ncbi:type VI secretion protein IcmF/TssM N-terminal domain-containing protein [uncultured Thiodictyon sp.]|uniref:type VI secretion protein IcmF/TssM N-terminal domain-containing protein n=1 Tax=uncultured Thiodictyon sp. TaxID=1846217 RepID=UPI0025D46A4E|nr:type VI secretion protein IcmF/TssM N-terminal domain-containing protein [uncultured Thiodictyon sp.]